MGGRGSPLFPSLSKLIAFNKHTERLKRDRDERRTQDTELIQHKPELERLISQ